MQTIRVPRDLRDYARHLEYYDWTARMQRIQESGVPMNAAAPTAAPSAAQPQAVAALPFVASSHEHTEPAFTATVTPGAVGQQLNPIDIPATGYLRHIFLEVVAAGGAAGTVAADGPWNLFSSVTLQDVNGANIVGPISGYSLYIANLLGGYAGVRNDPAQVPWFVGSAPNPAFFLRIPVEISHKDALGALGNQNSAANYKLTLAINTTAAMFSVAPTTIPTFTIRGWTEAWTLPAAADSRGRPQAQVPPLLGTGQYWSSRNQSGIVVGANTIPLTRLGNYLRLLAFISRDGTGARSDGVMPDPILFNWDGIQLRNQSQRYSQQEVWEKVSGPSTRPVGVFALPFNHGGPAPFLGDEDPDLWLPTSQTSRLEVTGNSTVAGTVEVLTCEVAPTEQDQTQRYVGPNADGSLLQPAVTA